MTYSADFVDGEILVTAQDVSCVPINVTLAWTPLDVEHGLTLRVLEEFNRTIDLQVGRFLKDGQYDPESDLISGTIDYQSGMLSNVLFAAPVLLTCIVKAYYRFDPDLNLKLPGLTRKE